MSGLALVLKNSGFEVTGSDLQRSETTMRLERAQIKIFYDHKAENIGASQVLVYSSAVSPDNPEIVFAKKTGRIVMMRAEMLQELIRMRYSIAIAGSHGKTTVTSLIAFLLERAGFDPTVVIGGRVKGWESGGRLGKSRFLVCEADESDKSFTILSPTIACVTNIDREHLDRYNYSLASLKNGFLRFLSNVPLIDGVNILCIEDPVVRGMINRLKRNVVTYGFGEDAFLRACCVTLSGFSASYTLMQEGKEVGRVQISIPGIHNVLNSLAACAVGFILEIPWEVIRKEIKEFSGVERRLEFKGEKKEIKVYDDYGHHPTEIKATLAALRNAYPDKRIVVVFQPHRYTRTAYLASEFGQAFSEANLLIITEIYSAGEAPIENVSGDLIYQAVKKKKETGVFFIPQRREIAPFLLSNLLPGDVLITLGAGDIWKTSLEILERL